MSQGDQAPIRPLTGVRVLAVENFFAGPYGSMLLADYGAEVVKVESPQGDFFRSYPPIYANESGEISGRFLRMNRNKRSMVVGLRSDEGRELFLSLAERSDVVWENYRPGAMDRLGLGWAVLRARNPRLIYATVSGFGHQDVLPNPMSGRPGFDIVAQAMAGLAWQAGIEGDPPIYYGISLADQFAGTMAAFGVVLALQWRSLTGQGQHVDLAMYDCAVTLNELEIGHYGRFGETAGRGVGTVGPFQFFRASDGWFSVGVSGDLIWKRFCEVIDRLDLYAREDLKDGAARARVQESLFRPLIEEWAADKIVDGICERLNAAGVPAGPVQTVPELFKCPQVKARKMLVELPDPAAGPTTLAGNPVKFSAVPESDVRAAPRLGADTDAVLREVLDLSDAAIEGLRERKVSGGRPRQTGAD
ncbi:MAG: CoA transferase [Thermomicrobiales bacterium]|nr:CoA transferase [Thermomicrobiales bacterium]